MQDMQDKTLAERAPSLSRIAGKAVCSGCDGEAFEVIIYVDGTDEACCLNEACRQVWTPIGKGSKPIARISTAVGKRGNEQGHMVSKKKRKR